MPDDRESSEAPGIFQSQTPQLTPEQLARQAMSLEQQRRIKLWNERLAGESGSYPMLPTPYRDGSLPMSPELYERILREDGDWINRYTSRRIAVFREEQAVRERRRTGGRPFLAEPSIKGVCLHFGIGVGRGMEYLREASQANLQLQLHDWSDVALAIGREKIAALLDEDPETLDLAGMVSWAEATQFFSSDLWDLDAQSVRILQFSCVLEHLTPAEAEVVARGLGKMLRDLANQLIIIDTPREGNEKFSSTTSRRQPEQEMDDFLLRTLAQGAERRVQLVDKESYVNLAEQHLVARTFRSI